VSGAIAGGLTTPLDVAKTRIMLEKPEEGKEPRYKGTINTLRLITAEEGAMACVFAWCGGGCVDCRNQYRDKTDKCIGRVKASNQTHGQ